MRGAGHRYHPWVLLPAPWLLAVALVLGLVVLLPARRLQLAGLSGGAIRLYAVFVWLLGFALVIRPGATRFLVPILLVAYLAPFVVAPDRLARFVRRGGRIGPGDPPKPPMKNITPPDGPVEP